MIRTLKVILAATTFAAVSIAVMALPMSASAQEAQNNSEPEANATVGETKQSDHRYALVKSNGDILRIDREAGSVSFCRKTNGTWRCMPAPLAEDAYLSEIAALSEELDRLKSQLANQKPETARPRTSDGQAAPSAGSDIPQDTPENPETAELQDQDKAAKPEKPSTRLSEEDEQQLEKMLQFSENAMRRFFGLMRDIQSELEGG